MINQETEDNAELGAYRPVRPGEQVNTEHIKMIGKHAYVPTRLYGKGPEHELKVVPKKTYRASVGNFKLDGKTIANLRRIIKITGK